MYPVLSARSLIRSYLLSVLPRASVLSQLPNPSLLFLEVELIVSQITERTLLLPLHTAERLGIASRPYGTARRQSGCYEAGRYNRRGGDCAVRALGACLEGAGMGWLRHVSTRIAFEDDYAHSVEAASLWEGDGVPACEDEVVGLC